MPSIPFVARADVPIVGQIKIHGWFPTVMMTCNCEAQTPMLIVGLGAIARCDKCNRAFMVGTIAHDQQTGAGSVNVVQVIVPAPAGPPS